MRNTGAGSFQTDFLHRFIKALAVFRFINGIGSRTDHRYAKLGQHPLAFQFQRTVQRRLAAHGRQYRVRALFFNDFTHHFPVNRLDISSIGHFRVGHNGCRVRVNQNHPVTLFAQRFTGLRARVVEFTSLADDDRASAKNQDTFYVVTFWHFLAPDYFAVER